MLSSGTGYKYTEWRKIRLTLEALS